MVLTEKDITKSWQSSEELVTIRCTAYNHEKYIACALDSFLCQVTTFPFKIFVHDDASTDNTAEIIREYQEKYPNIITCILEDENLCSKRDGSLFRMLLDNCKNKYIAVCEGDDYWIDNYKLQKQIDYMEAHPECSICFTNGYTEDQSNNCLRGDIFTTPKEKKNSESNHIITFENLDMFAFPPTASYVYRKEDIADIRRDVPACPNGDLRNRLYLMTKGYAYYFKDRTCVYRTNVPNSAMTKWKSHTKSQRYSHVSKTVDMICAIDRLTNFEHSKDLWKLKKVFLPIKIKNSPSLSVLKDKDAKIVFKEMSFLEKAKTVIKILLPEKAVIFLKNTGKK